MLAILRSIFGESPSPQPGNSMRARLFAKTWPGAIYAIGDVHGCLVLLREMERAIAKDAEEAGGDAWIVCLGDYVDRGPNSAGVIDYLLAPQPDGLKRICLAGNHEAMMLDHLHQPATAGGWLDAGAAETLASYGIDAQTYLGLSRKSRLQVLASHIPAEHVAFLSNLPVSLALPGAIFVHAGLRSGVAIDEQAEFDLLWIRGEFIDRPHTDGPWIVHGHTPVQRAHVDGRRIGIDTGAFATGCLSAVRLTAQGAPRFLTIVREPR